MFSFHAGGRNTPQFTTHTRPHIMLHPTHHFPSFGCSMSSRAADQYKNGIEAARRRMIWTCEVKRMRRENPKAWTACGIVERLT